MILMFPLTPGEKRDPRTLPSTPTRWGGQNPRRVQGCGFCVRQTTTIARVGFLVLWGGKVAGLGAPLFLEFLINTGSLDTTGGESS